jgi:hypothetical protein
MTIVLDAICHLLNFIKLDLFPSSGVREERFLLICAHYEEFISTFVLYLGNLRTMESVRRMIMFIVGILCVVVFI